MSRFASRRARRATIGRCAVLVIASIGWPLVASASHITDTDDFAEVVATALDYADQVGPERVLVVLDIDNTLLAMNRPLGSDQWFEWQRYLLEHHPNSSDCVADSFEGLLEAQGLLYNLARMHPPQNDLPLLVRELQGRGIRTLVLTSRGPEFRIATERELRRNGYDFARSALRPHNVPDGNYLPYDLEDPEADGLTKDELSDLGLNEAKPISYENGIMMTAGQNKGAMLLTMLHDTRDDFDAVVYDDDNIRHVAFVFGALTGRDREITAFHYTREEANMKEFQYGDKEDVTERWHKLNDVLEEVLE